MEEFPFTERVDSKLTDFKMESKPLGQPCTVCFRGCTVNLVRERHFIGGERTTKVVHNTELVGRMLKVAHPVHGGAAVFRSKGACRGAICQMLKTVLPPLIQPYADTKNDVQRWDKFVPAGLVESIVAGAAGGESYACDVWMHVTVTRVYSEAEELLRLCEAAAVARSSDAADRPRAGEACPICLNKLGDDGVTGMPDCSHAFHRACIHRWFGTAPTCPCCRVDMMHYLDPIRRRQRAYMTARIALAAAAFSSAEGVPLPTESEIAAVAGASPSAVAMARGAIRHLHQHRRAAPYNVHHDNRSDDDRVLEQALRLARGDTPDEAWFQFQRARLLAPPP